MKDLTHIKKGTDNGAFDWILENESHGSWAENNSDMIRKLVARHNQMVDYIKELESKIKL